MVDLPEPFSPHVVRHVRCISCRELFGITEDSNRRKSGSRPGANWRIVSAHLPDVDLRQQDVRMRQPISPQPRSEPHPDSRRPPVTPPPRGGSARSPIYASQDYHINCPRCGADNRNWLYFSLRRRWVIFGGVDAWYLPFFGIVLSTVIVAFVFIWGSVRNPETSLERWGVLAVVAVVASITISSLIVGDWKGALEARRVSKYLPGHWQPAPGLIWGLVASFVFVFVAPLIIYFAVPKVIEFVINPGPPPMPRQTAQAMATDIQQSMNSSDFPVGAISPASEALADIREFLGDLPADSVQIQTVENLISSLEAKQSQISVADLDISGYLDQLQTYVEENQTPNLQPPPFWYQRDQLWRHLVIWFMVVTAVSAISLVLATNAVSSQVRRIDGQIPRPIYYRVATMTRVAAWEAKHSLEIRGDMEHIQWMVANRLENGGIELVGLHRDVPEFDRNGRAIGEHVRAQRYRIYTDRWAHIEQAQVSDIRAPMTVDTPRFVVYSEHQQQEAQRLIALAGQDES